jgi:hypothetical protein
MCLTSDDAYLAVGVQASPFLLFYKRNGNAFTKLTPSSNPAGLVKKVA